MIIIVLTFSWRLMFVSVTVMIRKHLKLYVRFMQWRTQDFAKERGHNRLGVTPRSRRRLRGLRA